MLSTWYGALERAQPKAGVASKFTHIFLYLKEMTIDHKTGDRNTIAMILIHICMLKYINIWYFKRLRSKEISKSQPFHNCQSSNVKIIHVVLEFSNFIHTLSHFRTDSLFGHNILQSFSPWENVTGNRITSNKKYQWFTKSALNILEMGK